jgi:hypothetical protein
MNANLILILINGDPNLPDYKISTHVILKTDSGYERKRNKAMLTEKMTLYNIKNKILSSANESLEHSSIGMGKQDN